MMNIKSIAFFLLAINLSSFVFSQENSDGLSSRKSNNPGQDQRQIIKNSFFSIYPYGLTDGTKLWEKDIVPLLKTIPENKPYFHQLNILRPLVFTSLVIFGAGGIGSLSNGYEILSFQDSKAIAWTVTSLAGLSSMVITGIIRQNTITKAIKNYNLTIMGITIK